MVNQNSEFDSDEEYIVAYTKFVQDTLENKENMMHYFSKTFTKSDEFMSYFNFIKTFKGSIMGFDLSVGNEKLFGNFMIVDITLDIVNELNIIKHIVYIFIIPVKKE